MGIRNNLIRGIIKMENIEYTKAAKERINICDKITELIRHEVKAANEEWHIYTFKDDRGNNNPVKFKVHNTKKTTILVKSAIVPKKHLFSIYFKEESKQLVIEFTKHCYLNTKSFDLDKIKNLLPPYADTWNIDIINKL